MILPTLQTIQNNETVVAYKDEIFTRYWHFIKCYDF